MESRQRILIVDDSEMNRAILAEMLGEEYEIVEAENGAEAVALLYQQTPSISLVMLDIVMPEMDGFEVLAEMNKNHWIEEVPVIMISSETSLSSVERAYELGVTDFISRPFDTLIVRRRVVNTLALYAKQKKLIGMVADQIYEKQKSSNLMIAILSHIVEFRNGESGMHVLHINTMTEILLKTLVRQTDRYQLSGSDISLISMASTLHDIGKISVPEEILNKPGRLTPEEFEVMKRHALVGAEMLQGLPYQQEEPLVRMAYAICRWHHERYDGRGYPDGLKGEEIPIAAQVVSIADVYDALTSERVYKKAFSHEQAMEMIINGECGAFNPILLDCLKEAADQIRMELHVNSLRRSNDRERSKIADEMMRHEELSVSERTLRLLEHERTKYQFFASMSNEIQFEISESPAMITISDWGAEQLGVDAVLMDPMRNQQVLEVLGVSRLNEILRILQKTTPEDPVVRYECPLRVRGQERWHRLVCRSLWSAEEPPCFQGAIGKAIDVDRERSHLMSLQHRASHDALTGLLNQGSVRQEVEKLLMVNPRKNYALFMFDVDYLKMANDKYGHAFGDKLIQNVAERLRGSIRQQDIAARVGGDEFLVFLEYQGDVEALAERIFQHLNGEMDGFPVSVSMGIAVTERAGREYEVLFGQADRALYAGKRRGRNRYCFYDDTMEHMFSVLSSIDSDQNEEEKGD